MTLLATSSSTVEDICLKTSAEVANGGNKAGKDASSSTSGRGSAAETTAGVGRRAVTNAINGSNLSYATATEFAALPFIFIFQASHKEAEG